MVSLSPACSGTNVRRRILTKSWHLPVGLFVWAATCGCAVLVGKDKSQQEPERAQAMLAAARAHEINMFGELAGSEATYLARSAVSLQQHSFTEIGEDRDPDLDATGQRIVFSSTRHHAHADLYIKSSDGVAVMQLTSDPASDVQPVFGPDDQRIAFASDRAGSWDIWIIPVDGGQPVQVTHGPAEDVHPSWSPDGTRLVYCSLPPNSGQWELWITDVSAGGTRRFIGYGLFPEWSPTGDIIAYQRARERGSRWFGIWTLTLVNGEPRYPTELAWSSEEAYTLPTWSPDNAWIAFAAVRGSGFSNESQTVPDSTSDIWMMAADGRGKVRLTDGHTANSAPTFSPDGRVFFVSKRAGYENIWSLRPSRESIPGVPGDRLTVEPAGPQTSPDSVGKPYVRSGSNKDDL